MGTLIIAVTDNMTSMDVTPQSVGINGNSLLEQYQGQIIIARSYAEATGFIVAHKAGILFESITSKVSPIQVQYL